jgi:asparaginyl-tRNA synthetase
MEKTTINSLGRFADKAVTLEGWLYNSRASGKIQFLIIRDGTGLCQCIVEKGKVPDELFEELKHLGQESSLYLRSIWGRHIYFCLPAFSDSYTIYNSPRTGCNASR